MSYFLRGIIAKKEHVRRIITALPTLQSVELHQEFELIPITEDLFEALHSEVEVNLVNDFEFLSEYIERVLIDISQYGGIAYVESDMFGSDGGHCGIVWDKGKRIYEGNFHIQTMNVMLRLLRVHRERPDLDEFVSIGLDLCQSTEHWLSVEA